MPGKRDERIDARDIRDGGFSWTQDELLYVFQPLIGFEAAWLYTVMCKLIPQTIENPMLNLTMRLIQKTSGLTAGTLHRKMAVLTKIGMIKVERRGGRESFVYSLVSLRKLAAVGVDELKRRLSVPGGNTQDGGPEGSSSPEGAAEAPQSPASSDFPAVPESEDPTPDAELPAASGDSSVPGGNTGENSPETAENEDSENLSVPKKGGLCSKKGGVMFQGGTPFKVLNLSTSTKALKTPLPPENPGGVLEIILPTAECRAGDPNFLLSLGVAARWVAAQCGFTDRRMERVIAAALQRRVEGTGGTLEEAARLAAKRWAHFRGDSALMRPARWGAKKFFTEAHWLHPDTWPYDRELLREQARAAVGTNHAANGHSNGQSNGGAAEEAPEGVDVAAGAAIWAEVRKGLEAEINRQSFETWLKPLCPIGVKDGVLYVRIPSAEFAHVGTKYAESFAKFLSPAGVAKLALLGFEGDG